LRKDILGNLVEIQPGYQARGKIIESPIGSHRLLQSKDIIEEIINWESPLSFDPEINPDRYRISHNDILFIARGYENRAYLATTPPENILASNVFYIIKPFKIQSRFLAWWLNQKAAQAYFAQFQVKMGYAYMSKKNLSELEVPVPNIKTQETIAEVLRLWDREQTLTSEIKGRKESIMTSVLLTAAENKEG
jgi:restriction endonuclease S subunit